MDNLLISDLGLSNRAKNGLQRAGIMFWDQLKDLSEEDIYAIRNLGKKSADEILEKIREIKVNDEISSDLVGEAIITDMECLQECDAGKKFIISYLSKKRVTIDELSLLPPRAYNILTISGYSQLGDILFLNKEELKQISTLLDDKLAMVIEGLCKHYLEENQTALFDAYKEIIIRDCKEETTEDKKDSIYDRELALEYVRNNDIELKKTTLSVRAKNALSRNDYKMLSDFIFIDRNELQQIHSMGATTIVEIENYCQKYLEDNKERITAYCSGDTSVLFSDEYIQDQILGIYKKKPFRGFSFQEFKDELDISDSITDDILKRNIGKLLADGKLEYVDYRCFRVYKRYIDVVRECSVLDDRSKEIIEMRMHNTLQEVGDRFDITRERIRQITKKSFEKVVAFNLNKEGTELFDEDYYRYLYQNYYFDKHDGKEWLGISDEVYRYLDLLDVKQGKKDIAEALDDTQNIETGLRIKIKNYINRNKIYLDGRWIENKRADIEEYVLEKFCRDDVIFDDFCAIYNNFLESQEIEYDEKIYYTTSVINTRKNHLAESKKLVWKFFGHMRYYDIDGQDYEDLYSELNLKAYENTEISTFKLFKDHPDLMKMYDIRDHYELHNIIKKSVDKEKYHDISFMKMPIIRFGEFDRKQALMDLLIEYAPISIQDFLHVIENAYGYDQTTIQGCGFEGLTIYSHNGIFSIDQKEMPSENMKLLAETLTGEFYFIDEIKNIYSKLFPGSDIEEVNPYNLKLMGFIVNSNYAIQNYQSMDAYITCKLTEGDIVDIYETKKRLSNLRGFYAKYTELRKNLTVVEFEPDRLITRKKLEENGITLELIKAFCDEVFDYVEDNTYFSINSIRQKGFKSELFDYGFSDMFYANLLYSDERFTVMQMFSCKIIYKGKEEISTKSFELSLVKEHGSIDLFDLMNEMVDIYGCTISERLELVYKLNGTDVYYDKYLDRLYTNIEMYYRELGVEG